MTASSVQAPTGARSRFEYVLGDSPRESARLQVQSELWDPVSRALFDRIGVQPGWRVLELGPGRGSLHLELRRRVQRPIDAVERSEVFAAALREQCERDGLGEGRIWQCDVLDAPLPSEHYDLVFARWVFLFLPEAAAHVRKLAAALRPGGLLVIQDYFRDTFSMLPRPPHWDALAAADREFFATQGGDTNIGARLPSLYLDAGLQLVETVPHLKVGHPGSAVWQWLSEYYLGILDRYATLPSFSLEQAEDLRTAWLDNERQPGSLLVAPTVLDVVGRKPLAV